MCVLCCVVCVCCVCVCVLCCVCVVCVCVLCCVCVVCVCCVCVCVCVCVCFCWRRLRKPVLTSERWRCPRRLRKPRRTTACRVRAVAASSRRKPPIDTFPKYSSTSSLSLSPLSLSLLPSLPLPLSPSLSLSLLPSLPLPPSLSLPLSLSLSSLSLHFCCMFLFRYLSGNHPSNFVPFCLSRSLVHFSHKGCRRCACSAKSKPSDCRPRRDD